MSDKRPHELFVERIIDLGYKLGFHSKAPLNLKGTSAWVDAAWFYPLGVLNRLTLFAVFEVAMSDMLNRKNLHGSAKDLEDSPAFLKILIAPISYAKKKHIAQRYLEEVKKEHSKIEVVSDDDIESAIIERLKDLPSLEKNQIVIDGFIFNVVSPKGGAIAENLYYKPLGFPTWLIMPEHILNYIVRLIKEGKKLGMSFDKVKNRITISDGFGEPCIKGFDEKIPVLFIDEKSDIAKILKEWGKTGIAYARNRDNVIIIPYKP